MRRRTKLQWSGERAEDELVIPLIVVRNELNCKKRAKEAARMRLGVRVLDSEPSLNTLYDLYATSIVHHALYLGHGYCVWFHLGFC